MEPKWRPLHMAVTSARFSARKACLSFPARTALRTAVDKPRSESVRRRPPLTISVHAPRESAPNCLAMMGTVKKVASIEAICLAIAATTSCLVLSDFVTKMFRRDKIPEQAIFVVR